MNCPKKPTRKVILKRLIVICDFNGSKNDSDINKPVVDIRNVDKRDYTMQLLKKTKHASKEQVSRAFNSIRDMMNKQQINDALLMVPKIKDRVILIEKMLDRREEIAKAKEMEVINSNAPLFKKIKQKFLQSLRRESHISIQKDKNDSQNDKLFKEIAKDTSQQIIKQSYDPLKDIPQEISVSKIIYNKQIDSSQFLEDKKSSGIQSYNVMGAVSLFANQYTHNDKEKVNGEKTSNSSKLLGYLQKDNLLQNEERNSLIRKSGSPVVVAISSRNSISNLSNSTSILNEKKDTTNNQDDLDISQKIQIIRKKMFQITSNSGRRSSAIKQF